MHTRLERALPRPGSVLSPAGAGGLLVLGLGNDILGDDAVGLHALRSAQASLRERGADAAVSFKELNAGGFDLMYEVEGYDALVVVDAWFTRDSVPGRVRVLGPEAFQPSSSVTSAHLLSLPGALALSARLGYTTPALIAAVVIEVDERCHDFGTELSADVARSVPAAAAHVVEVVEAHFAGDG